VKKFTLLYSFFGPPCVLTMLAVYLHHISYFYMLTILYRVTGFPAVRLHMHRGRSLISTSMIALLWSWSMPFNDIRRTITRHRHEQVPYEIIVCYQHEHFEECQKYFSEKVLL